MPVLTLGIAAVAAILVFFRYLQWLSDRTYKPTSEEVIGILEASLEGRLDLSTLDRFSCVRIAYDPRLEQTRKRFNSILDDPQCVTGRT